MTVDRVSAADVRDRMAQGQSLVLLDCRENEELQIASIEGAVHIPMGDIPGRLPTLDPDREYVVFCHHGKRSQSVAAFLKEQGFEHVASLNGGIDAWSVEINPRVPRY